MNSFIRAVGKYFGMICLILGNCVVIALALDIAYGFLSSQFDGWITIPFQTWLTIAGCAVTLKQFILKYLRFNANEQKNIDLYTPEGFSAILTVVLNDLTYVIVLFIISGLMSI